MAFGGRSKEAEKMMGGGRDEREVELWIGNEG